MKVQDVMTKKISYCNPTTNAASAAELMWTSNCGALPVVEDGQLVGIVTDRDLFIALGTNNSKAGDFPVGALMEKQVATCAPGDEVRAALETMAASGTTIACSGHDGCLKRSSFHRRHRTQCGNRRPRE
jgi:CBS domain-containing protein